MVDVITHIEISCKHNEVALYSANPDNAMEWYANIKSTEWLTPKPMGMGTKIAYKAHFLGKELVYTYEVVEFVPLKRLVMQTANGPFPMETSYEWKATGDNSTFMSLRNRGNPKGFSKLFVPFMSLAMRKANKKDLKRLKKILENSDYGT
ncbi:SRPBCC family protein [Spongiimicrobium sp. 3-5]|uniref:SRPBCC family protein n=1 Tax=Spongiimicrobium sp. 3-5 TaxID=3332596 RepID=UPI003980F094